MPPSRRPRLLRVALAGAAVLVVGPLSLTPAAAEETPAGDTVTGEVVRTFAEPYDHEKATAVHEEPMVWVEPTKGAAVRLTGKEAEELPVGATVEAQVGEEVVDAAAAAGSLEPARELVEAEVLAGAAAGPVSATAVHTVTVALVAPAEFPIPQAGDFPDDLATAEELAALVEGPVADFWAQESYGAIQLDVQPVDIDNQWTKSNISCATPSALWTETANRVGFVAGPSKHLLLYLPEAVDPEDPDSFTPCEYGWADVGTSRTSGGRAYVRDHNPSVIAHELGHNFSLGHSSLQQCDSAIEGPVENCDFFPYYDLYDVMGATWDHLGSLSALHQRRIGVLPLARVHQVSVTAPTKDYVLSPIGTRTGFAGIRLAWGDLVYFLEYRTATGQDTWLDELVPGQPPLKPGVLLRVQDNADGDTSLLLDGSPTPAAGHGADLDTVLPAQKSYWLAGGAFHVTVKSTSASSATVRVSTAAGAPLPRDLSGDYVADMVAKDSAGTLYNYRATATGGFGTRVVSARGWQSRDLITNAGDWNGDGAHDLIARDSRNGDLWLYRGNNRSGFVGWGIIGRGWSDMTALFAPGDWNGDGFWDLLARKRDGSLMLYPGNGKGGFLLAGVTKLAGSWNGMTAFASTGDWDNNGTVDFITLRNDGLLFLYSGNGSGAFSGSPRIIGRGWGIFTAITGPGDWDSDGDSYLLVRRSDGSVWLYRGNGTGGFEMSPAARAPGRIGAGWSSLRLGS